MAKYQRRHLRNRRQELRDELVRAHARWRLRRQWRASRLKLEHLEESSLGVFGIVFVGVILWGLAWWVAMRFLAP